MAAYHYRAMNQSGKSVSGVIEADSDKDARQKLRHQALFPVEVMLTQQKALAKKSQWTFSFRKSRLNASDLALMTRQCATLLSAGLPLEEVLAAVSEQSESETLKGLVLSVRSKVLEGHSYAMALSQHPESFSPLYVATVAAGEKTGHLDKILTRLADYTEQQATLRQKLKTALIYPAMILLVAVSIVGFLLEFVVPKMVSVYGHMKQALPFLTSLLIGISDTIKHDGLYVLIVIVIGIYFFKRALNRNKTFRFRVHQFLLKLPLFGYGLKTADTARFSRTLSMLTASGVPALEAMTVSAELLTMLPIRQSVMQAVRDVREGKTIYAALKQAGYFSPMSLHMIASGEASGQLEQMLARVATMQEEEMVRLIDVSLALFEPAIILIMGAVILFIVLAVLLPIFQLNDMAG